MSPPTRGDAGDEPVAIATITASELLHGVERAGDATVRQARSHYVESLLADLPILPFGVAEARRQATVWATLAAAGRIIGPHDLMVAATALSHGSAVPTLNQKEFSRVPGLALKPVAPFLRRDRAAGRRRKK